MAKQKYSSGETALTITAMLHLHEQNYSLSKGKNLKLQKSLEQKKKKFKKSLFTIVEVQLPTIGRQFSRLKQNL